MIKENVLRKNLLNNVIDYGNVDTVFETENLAGNIIVDFPFIEIDITDPDYQIILFNKKKEELLKYCDQQRTLRKDSYSVLFNGNPVAMKGGIDDVINLLSNLKLENVYPRLILDNTFTAIFEITDVQQLDYVLNKLRVARMNNYNANLVDNAILVNACQTLQELNDLQLNFVDLVIEL